MDKVALESAMRALWAAEITQQEFLKRTRVYWRAVARGIFSTWRKKLPAWVEPADVEQELMMVVLRTIPLWDPERSSNVRVYVTWCAVHRTQRELHRWRGALLRGNEARNPSRFEAPLSRLPGVRRESDEAAQERAIERSLPAQPPEQEQRAEAAERFSSLLRRCQTPREALVLLALRQVDGETARAAALLFESFAARVECELEDEEHAREVVEKSARAIAVREFGRGCGTQEDRAERAA